MTCAQYSHVPEHTLLLDNQAGTSIFHNRSLCHSTGALQRPIIIDGINGEELTITEGGVFRDVCPVALHALASKNVLSFGQVKSLGHDMDYNKHADAYTMCVRGKTMWTFDRLKRADGTKINHYGVIVPTDTPRTAAHEAAYQHRDTLVHSLRDIRSRYSKGELARIDNARFQNECMGWPTVQTQLRLTPTINNNRNRTQQKCHFDCHHLCHQA